MGDGADGELGSGVTLESMQEGCSAVKNGIYNEAWLRSVAKAACLPLREESISDLMHWLGEELRRMGELKALGGSEDLNANALELCQLREDVPEVGMSREELLKGSDRVRNGCFAMPSVFGEEGEP